MAPTNKKNNNGRGRSTKSFSRGHAKKIASNKMYTARGEPIQNLEAYVAAGGKPRSSSGKVIHNPTAYRNTIEASVRQNTGDPKYLYHYTNNDAAQKIEQSGVIRASKIGLDGAGTYVTAKPPRCTTNTLISNNYGAPNARDSSFVNNYIRVNADELNNARRVDSTNRDVWKVEGDIDLHENNGFVAQRNNRKSTKQAEYGDTEYNESGYYHDTGYGASEHGESPNNEMDYDYGYEH